MKPHDLKKLGIPPGPPMEAAFAVVRQVADEGGDVAGLMKRFAAVSNAPDAYAGDALMGPLARALAESTFRPRAKRAPYRQWGNDLDPASVQQMANACNLPVSVRGALMPDAHVGYGLPIGGVLATENAVVPYAVGVDIACRMKMTVLDLPVESFDKREDTLIDALEEETRFGIGAEFKSKREHEVLDRDWSVSPITQRGRDKAWKQLGTSGSGNHFVEFGEFELSEPRHGLQPGRYLALLSHSGSRGTGAAVCGHYSRIARERHKHLPKELTHLSWLELDTEAGAEYWAAMNLMGEYAAANHACIHRHIAERLGAQVLLDVENHHNFAWKEEHEGRELIVHRKGATPAGEGVPGIIPGSMASPTYLVRGKGNAESLCSSSHGAGRVMSRSQAHRTLSWDAANAMLKQRGVKLLSAGLDEVPAVYKDIDEVMAAQRDLVDVEAKFLPRLVKMAPAGERPED